MHGRVSENCLYLNIWALAHATRPLPVMMWIPGGEFITEQRVALKTAISKRQKTPSDHGVASLEAKFLRENTGSLPYVIARKTGDPS